MYLTYVSMDMISHKGDRYYFFSDSHPNLGGELISSAVIMATISLKPKHFFMLAVPALYCTFLLQSRTSTIAILISVFCFITLWSKWKFGWKATRWAILTTPALLLGVFASLSAIGSEETQEAFDLLFDSVFLVDDEYRGGESGFSGRDQHWGDAIEVIMNHPFFGAGPNFMDRLGVLQPHNWILYAISQFGFLGLVLVLVFIAAAYEAARRDPIRLAVLTPLFVPWLLNDRFLNFNAYPFILYIVVFTSFRHGDPSRRPVPLRHAPQRGRAWARSIPRGPIRTPRATGRPAR